jgi:hypothetical protein
MSYFFFALCVGIPALFLLCRIAIECQHFSRRRSAGSILHRFGIASSATARSSNFGNVSGCSVERRKYPSAETGSLLAANNDEICPIYPIIDHALRPTSVRALPFLAWEQPAFMAV